MLSGRRWPGLSTGERAEVLYRLLFEAVDVDCHAIQLVGLAAVKDHRNVVLPAGYQIGTLGDNIAAKRTLGPASQTDSSPFCR